MDNQILNFFSIRIKNKVFDFIMPYFSNINNFDEVWILIALLFLLYGLHRKYIVKDSNWSYYFNICMQMLISLLFAYIIGEVWLKNMIKRPRPFNLDKGYDYLIAFPKSYSMPSGHAASSFAAAGIIYFNRNKFRTIALLLAFVIAFSRLYLHVHYPTDILIGAILGLGCSALVAGFFNLTNIKK